MSCRIVGYLDLREDIADYLISINVSSSTEINKVGDDVISGPTIGKLDISGYADLEMYEGFGGSASVNINYIQKYDCDNDKIYLLFGGGGEANISGDVAGLATIGEEVTSHKNMDASIANGPAEIYFENTTKVGYGLSYTGKVFTFNTEDPNDTVKYAEGWGKIYLQSFSLNCNPGDVPRCNYSFIFSPNNNIIALPKEDN